MTHEATAQLNKVRRVSEGIKNLAHIITAFWAISMLVGLFGIAFAGSFQLNLGDGDLGVNFFSNEPQQAVITLYDTKIRFGVNIEEDSREVTRLVTEPDLLLRATTGVLLFLNAFVVCVLLEHVAKLFSYYAKGDIFTRDVVARIRMIGFAMIGFSVVSLLNSIFGVVLVSIFGTDTGSAHFSMRIGMLWAALLLILVSWIMDVGRALREENELVI